MLVVGRYSVASMTKVVMTLLVRLLVASVQMVLQLSMVSAVLNLDTADDAENEEKD